MSQLRTGRQVLNMIPSQRDWFTITDAAEVAEVWLYDEVGMFGTTAADFTQELNALKAATINVYIASLGGDVFDGIAIYNALRMHRARIAVRVDSIAGSVASVIAQAGDTRAMVTGSQMMIHKAHMIAAGNDDDFEDFVAILRQQNDIIAGIYAERAGDGRRKSHFLALMKQETWMAPAQAVAEGLADSIIKPDTGGTVPASTESAADEEALDMTDFLASPDIVPA